MNQERLADFLRTLFEQQANVDAYARVLWLRHMEGMTYREIADVSSISTARVGQMIRHAEHKIRWMSLVRQGPGSDYAAEKRRRIRDSMPPQMIAAIIQEELPE